MFVPVSNLLVLFVIWTGLTRLEIGSIQHDRVAHVESVCLVAAKTASVCSSDRPPFLHAQRNLSNANESRVPGGISGGTFKFVFGRHINSVRGNTQILFGLIEPSVVLVFVTDRATEPQPWAVTFEALGGGAGSMCNWAWLLPELVVALIPV